MPYDVPIESNASRRSAGRRWAWGAIILLFAIHSIQAVRLFPTPGSIIDPDSPVIVVDHAIHEYHGSLGAGFLRESGTTWGFDPFFMAGYPETPVWDSSSNPSILFNLIGGPKGYRGYKVGLLASSILLLAAVAGGAWAAGLGAWEIAVATGLAWFSFWTGFPISLWRSGLFAFVSASAGVGLLLGLCVRFDRKPGRAGWLALASVGAGLFFVHVTAPILAIGGTLAFYLTVARRHGRRWHAAVIGSVVVTVLANAFWLVPLWRFRSIRTPAYGFMTSNSARFLLDFFLSPSIEGRTGLFLLILGFGGLLAWWFSGRRASAAAYGGSIVALIVLTGFGSLWEPSRTLEPLRFRIAFGFLLAVPAGSALVGLTDALIRRAGGRGRGKLAAGLAWLAIVGGWGWADWLFFRASWLTMVQDRPLVVGFTPEMRRLAEWFRGNTDLSARILFEDQLRLLEPTDPESVHWTPLLPSMLEPDRRMFLGGLYQTAFIQHHRMAAFGDFQLGDRPIDEWSPPDLKAYSDRYNVGWVVCWSPLSRFWFDRFGPATRVATLPRHASPNRPVSNNEHEWTAMTRRAGPEVARRYMIEGENRYAIYRIERPHSYFLKGKGRIVEASPNRIELADVEPDGGAVVLSLHWLETWVTDPPLKVGPEPESPDPVDFVRIEVPGPTPRIVLFNGYGR
ncbi:hypothetical protein P12x_002131 [Tundrisphaera lichenicola]|uniref:hypothetical protein n=1 Tax=Tundrisphaera lichenicola TaxID=2029860 RepID=UPI003EBF874A